MKKLLSLFFALAVIISLDSCSFFDPKAGGSGEDWKSQEVEEEAKYKYYQETYEKTYDAPFQTVWNSALESVQDDNCQIITKKTSQNDMGLYQGLIRSDYCIFARGDTTLDNLKYYSLEVPFIRGSNWITGRIQYEFDIDEQEDGTVHVELEGEISGYEKQVTSKMHFWESNGYLETMMLQKVTDKVKKAK